MNTQEKLDEISERREARENRREAMIIKNDNLLQKVAKDIVTSKETRKMVKAVSYTARRMAAMWDAPLRKAGHQLLDGIVDGYVSELECWAGEIEDGHEEAVLKIEEEGE